MSRPAVQFFQKNKHILVAIALFVITMLIFAFFMGETVAAAQYKGRSKSLNPNEARDEVYVEDYLGMDFVFDGELYAVALQTRLRDDAVGTLRLYLYDEKGNELASSTLDSSKINPGGYASFEFQNAALSESGKYTLKLFSDSSAVPFAVSKDAPEGWRFYSGDDELQGALLFVGEVERLGIFINVFYWVFAVVVAVSISGIYLFCRSKKLPLYKVYAIAAVLLGVIYCFVLPPYSAPDEQFHINEAFTISSGWLGDAKLDNLVGGYNVKRADDNNAVIENLNTSAFSYKEIFDNIFSTSKDSSPVTYKGDLVGGYKLIYWPAALIVTICRLIGIGFVPTLLLGRFINLAIYIVLASLAVKFAPFKKSIFVFIGLLPMSLHLAASFSRDAITIALYMFFTAFIFHLMYSKNELSIKDVMIAVAAGVSAVPAKIAYAPVVALLLLLPSDKFQFRGKKIDKKYVKAAKITAAVGVFIVFIVAALPYIKKTLMMPLDESLATHPDQITYTLPYIFANLKETLWLLLNTLFSNTTFYLNTLVGGKLGYYNIDIDWFFVLVLFVLMLLSLLPQKGEGRLSKKVSYLGIGLSVVSSLLVVYACLGWTPTYFTTVYGIQGRYFLPVLALLLCCISSRIKSIEWGKNIENELLFSEFTVSSFVALNAFLVILER